MKIAIPSATYPGSHAYDCDHKKYFGLEPKAKWPAQGMNNPDGSTKDVFVQGDYGKVRLWVNPEPMTRTFQRAARIKVRKSSTHRLQCMCPVCGSVMSAGRLQQHVKIHD